MLMQLLQHKSHLEIVAGALRAEKPLDMRAAACSIVHAVLVAHASTRQLFLKVCPLPVSPSFGNPLLPPSLKSHLRILLHGFAKHAPPRA